MRPWRPAAACALGVAALLHTPVAPCAEAPQPIPALLEACAARLEVERDIGVERVFAACPQVEGAFGADGVRPWLPIDWRTHGEELSADSLRALASLLRELGATPARDRPDPRLLAQVLAESVVESGAGDGFWRRLLRWLRTVATASAADAQSRPFTDWLRAGNRAEIFWTVTGYVALLLALVFAAWIVRGELRMLRFGRRAPAAAAAAPLLAALPADAEFDLAGAPLAERPALLLRRLTATLAVQPGLLRTDAWTVDELLASRPFADRERSAQLELLARVAEAVRYAPRVPDEATLRAATLAGESLCGLRVGPAP